ncbi:hypothetical protein D3C80_2125750 [compost metagenome]
MKTFGDGDRTTVRLPTISHGLSQFGHQVFGIAGHNCAILGVGHYLNLKIE